MSDPQKESAELTALRQKLAEIEAKIETARYRVEETARLNTDAAAKLTKLAALKSDCLKYISRLTLANPVDGCG